jgi:hypothetical protein
MRLSESGKRAIDVENLFTTPTRCAPPQKPPESKWSRLYDAPIACTNGTVGWKDDVVREWSAI